MKSPNAASAHLKYRGADYSVSIENFGPEEAAMALSTNRSNRPLSAFNIGALTSALRRGEWKLNGETIVFDSDGRLIQGQHRLTAVIKSGVWIESFVIRGVPSGVFATMDQGKKRSGSDVLAVEGKSNSVSMASAARAILMLSHVHEVAAFQNYSQQQILDVVEAHPMIEVWVSRFAGSDMRKFLPAAFAGVLTLAAERHGGASIAEFFDQVQSGEHLERTMPAYVLRERFMNRTRGTSMNLFVSIALCIKAVNAHISGARIKILRFSPDEAFPTLL